MLLTMPMPPSPAPAGPARRLRVLVLDEALPYPPDSGKRLRSWHLLTRLAARHQITLLCYGDAEAARQAAAVEALTRAGITCQVLAPPAERAGAQLYLSLLANLASRWPYSVAKHHSRRFQAAVEGLCRAQAFDLVQVEWTPYASHLSAEFPAHLIASHNIEAQIWQRRAAVSRWPARAYFGMQAAKMRRFERGAFTRARWVTTVSAEDRTTALGWGARQASVVPNGVDLEAFPARSEVAPTAGRLLFVGALDWFANEDAVRYFAGAILPRIRATYPQAHLQVVGRRPSSALARALATTPGIELVGEVEAVQPYLAAAAVVVVPLRIGGGSRIKIVEALAMGKPVVATAVGAEGLGLQAGAHLQLAQPGAEEAEDFARRTVGLLQSPETGERLARAGQRWVRKHHGWDACAGALEQAWRQAAGDAA